MSRQVILTSSGCAEEPLPDTYQVRDLTRFELDFEWRFHFLDRNFVLLTGYNVEDFLAGRKSLLDIVHDMDRQYLVKQVDVGFAQERYCSAEFRINTGAGKTAWLWMRGPISEDASGRPARIKGVISDISALKATQLELRYDWDYFASLADTLEDPLCVIGDDYRIKFMNRPMIAAVGDRVGQICYRALFNREGCCSIPSDLADNWIACFFHNEGRLAGSDKIYEVRSLPVITTSGSKVRISQFRDVSRQKKTEGKLRGFAHHVRAISKAANMAELGIFIVAEIGGREARFRFANAAFCHITGYTAEELLEMTLAQVIQPDFVEAAMGRYRRRLKGESVRELSEIKLLRKNGTSVTVFVMGALSLYRGSYSTVGFVRDITGRKQLEESLLLSQRLAAIGKLSAELAHEINNPLTSVMTFNKLIEKIMQQEPFPLERVGELQDYIRFVNNEAGRCADIARNLLNFSRTTDVRIEEHDVHEILKKSLKVFLHRAEMGNIKVMTSYSPEAPLIQCDFNRLQQAFINILWNAIEAMPEGGVLSVATSIIPQSQRRDLCEAGKNLVEVSISDTGVGIPQENLDKIFEPFFSTKTEKSGVGLGLSVAYGVVSKHGGQIRVQSEVGKGTLFTIGLATETCATSSMLEC
jgi:PAS domain S-box-containing protein